MFILGHAGIGGEMADRVAGARWRRWLLVGTLLPDLVDKPLYYGLCLATGRSGAALGVISGTRSIGHTAIALAVVLLVGLALRHRGVVALAAGMATHLFLDELGDVASGASLDRGTPALPSTLCAIFFPVCGPRFPVSRHDALTHLVALGTAYIIAGELVGAALLYRRYRRERVTRRPPPSAGPG